MSLTALAPEAEAVPEPDPDVPESLSFCCNTFNSSNPASPLAAFAAFFVESVNPFIPLVASSALLATSDNSLLVDCTVDESSDLFPVIMSVNDLNIPANVVNFPIKVLTNFITGVNTLMSPCPIEALKLSNCNDNNLV